MSDTPDFDAWRAQTAAARQERTVPIFGQDVPVPHAISLDLVMRVDETDVDDTEALADLVGEMFGEGELNRWREAGCDMFEFAVLLAWGSACGQGADISFDEAAERVRQRSAGKAPAPNRATRRAQGKKRRKRN